MPLITYLIRPFPYGEEQENQNHFNKGPLQFVLFLPYKLYVMKFISLKGILGV